MDGDMAQLLDKHGLQAVVPFFEAQGVYFLEGLRMVKESDVDTMAQRRGISSIIVNVLKSKIRNKVLVVELEQEKAQQAEQVKYTKQVHKHTSNLSVSHSSSKKDKYSGARRHACTHAGTANSKQVSTRLLFHTRTRTNTYIHKQGEQERPVYNDL